jgi:hypothetical protein
MLKVNIIKEVGLELVTGLYHCGSPELERKRKQKNKIEQYYVPRVERKGKTCIEENKKK